MPSATPTRRRSSPRSANVFEKGRRKGKVPTVVMAERWQDRNGEPLIVFYETGPCLLPDRDDPFHY